MGEYKPLVVFMLVTTLLSVFINATYTAFGLELTAPEDASDTVQFYFDIKEDVENVGTVTFLGISINLLDILIIPALVFSDYFASLILVWASLPTAVFAVLFTPLLAGLVYAIIKALPTT